MGRKYEIWKAAFIIYSLSFSEKAPLLLREEKKRKPSKHFFLCLLRVSLDLPEFHVTLLRDAFTNKTFEASRLLTFKCTVTLNAKLFSLPSALHHCLRRTSVLCRQQ